MVNPTCRTIARAKASAVRVVEQPDTACWNESIRSQPGSLFFRAEWERVFGVYGLKILRLAALRDDRIVGVLPLVWQHSFVFGNQLVSLPWFDAAGVLVEDAEAAAALIFAARQAAADRGAQTVQLRQATPLDVSADVRTDKVLVRRRLEPDSESFQRTLKAKVRNQIRKAQKSGLTIERGGRELLDDFYNVYSINMRDLGSPAHHRKLFDAVFDSFSAEASVYVVRLKEHAVGAGLTMANGNRLEIPWASSLRRYNGLCANHLMYSQILGDACDAGFEWFHFGRSTVDTGPYRFKMQWGAEPVQLYWYYLNQTDRVADSLKSPQKSFGWGSRLWQKLPVWLSRRLGPHIIAKVP